MMRLVALELVAESTKKTIAIRSDFLDFQTEAGQLLSEVYHVRLIPGLIELLLGAFHLAASSSFLAFLLLRCHVQLLLGLLFVRLLVVFVFAHLQLLQQN